MIRDFNDIKAYLWGKDPLRLVVVAADDEVVLSAAKEAACSGWVKIILIGDKAEIEKNDFSGCQITIIDESGRPQAAEIGANLLARGEGDLIMKGSLMTADFLKPVLKKERRLVEDGRLLSHVSVVALPGRERLTMISDAAVNILPDQATKEQIIDNALNVAKVFGYNPPRVAVLSAIEKENPKIPSSLEAGELMRLGLKGRFGDILISGPLALDNALSEDSVINKGLEDDPVAGKADILIVPELVSGNILYKSFSIVAGFATGGVVLGAKIPIVLTSRADSSETKANSIALACFLKHRQQATGNRH